MPATARARSRKSAKDAGTRFESAIAECLRAHVDDRIERRTKTGNKDRGDLSGWRYGPHRIVAEIKNTSRINLGAWAGEAEIERLNDDAHVAVVIHKRHGKGDPLDQWVTCTLRDLIALTTMERPA